MCSRRDGFSVIEVLIAATLVASTLVGLAHLVAVGAQRALASRYSAGALAAAQSKLEELRAAAWTYAADGTRQSASVLAPSPPGSLDEDTSGYVDYLDGFGQSVPPVGGETAPDYVRRWSITPLSAGDLDTLVLRTCVFTARGVQTGEPNGRGLCGLGANENAMNQRGYSLIELLVACLLLMAVTAAVAGMAVPARHAFERTLASADLTGGTRAALERLASDVREAGSGGSVGIDLVSVSDVMASIVPLAGFDSPPAAPGQAIRITRIPPRAPQGVLRQAAPAGETTLVLEGSSNCSVRRRCLCTSARHDGAHLRRRSG